MICVGILDTTFEVRTMNPLHHARVIENKEFGQLHMDLNQIAKQTMWHFKKIQCF
jgi:hypothetical protein